MHNILPSQLFKTCIDGKVALNYNVVLSLVEPIDLFVHIYIYIIFLFSNMTLTVKFPVVVVDDILFIFLKNGVSKLYQNS